MGRYLRPPQRPSLLSTHPWVLAGYNRTYTENTSKMTSEQSPPSIPRVPRQDFWLPQHMKPLTTSDNQSGDSSSGEGRSAAPL